MSEYEDLQQTLQTVLEILHTLENMAAKYTPGSVPEYLQVQLEEKRREVTNLQSRLKSVSDNLPVRPFVFIGRDEEKNKCLNVLSPEQRG
ncbi:MAG: hypothetical protein JXA33_19605 [Anaerolineae bacterium]|nr:hypothetical protein [Anaerolineae bacterium]